MTAQHALEPLMTIPDVMARLRMCERTVRAHKVALNGRLIGGRLLFRAADVLAYEDRQRVQGEQPAAEPVTSLVKEREQRRPAVKHTSPINKVTGEKWKQASR